MIIEFHRETVAEAESHTFSLEWAEGYKAGLVLEITDNDRDFLKQNNGLIC
jgi:hypothetical protein